MRALLAVGLGSLAWRRWSTLGLLAAAVAAFAAASVGPLWANATEDSLLQTRLGDASPEQTSITFRAYGNDVELGNRIPALAVDAVRDAAEMTPLLDSAFGPGRLSLATSGRTAVEASGGGGPPTRVLSPLAWLPGGCGRLRVESGRCPVSDREVALSGRTARLLGTSVGARVVLPQLAFEPDQPGTGEPFPSRLRVVGIYQRPGAGSAYWAGTTLFDFAPGGLSARDPAPPRTDAAFTTGTLLERLAETTVVAEMRRRYAPGSPRAEVVDPVEEALGAWVADHRGSVGTVTVEDAALRTLVALHDERGAVRLASYVLSLQLLALACYVLFLLTSVVADSRSNDLALAKLRGLRPPMVGLVALLEPLAVVLAALPLGYGLGLAGTQLAADALLPGDVGARPDTVVVGALALALAGALVAGALGLRKAVTQPLLSQLQRVAAGAGGPRAVVVETVLVTAAIAALWQVQARGGEATLEGLALLAPGLTALAAGVLAGRAMQQMSRAWALRTRRGGDIAGFLAARQIARRAGGSRVAVIATVSVSLAAFAASTWGLVERQRDSQAAMEVGAASVYRVDATSPARLLTAVRSVDPSGDMFAAAVRFPGDRPEDQLLAVDSRRLAAVAAWQPAWASRGVEALAGGLRSATAPSLVVAGQRMRVGLVGGVLSGGPTTVLVATVVDRDGREHPVSFGEVAFGPQTLEADVDGCGGGCRVATLGLVRASGEVGAVLGKVTFRSLTVDDAPVPRPFRLADWRPSRVTEAAAVSSPVAVLRPAAGGGLEMSFNASPSQNPALVRGDVPAVLPVIATESTVLAPLGRDDLVLIRGLGGRPVPSTVLARAEVLPRIGGLGVVADLEAAARMGPDPLPGLTFEVWASERAPGPATVRELLGRAGLAVLHREVLDQRAEQLAGTGPALALHLLLGVALAALSVSTLALLATALVQGRRRAYELAALQTAGVGPADLRRALAREQAAQLAFGTVVGLLSGTATARVLGDAVAGLGRAGTVAPVAESLEWLALLPLTTLVLVIFTLVVQACARAVVRFADPEVLRGAPT